MDIIIEVNNISSIKQLSQEACEQALELWGRSFENHAADYAPVDTGRLQNSIEHHPEGDDTMVVQTNVEYAVYQELGTLKQKGTPFFRPAANNHLAEYKALIEQALESTQN